MPPCGGVPLTADITSHLPQMNVLLLAPSAMGGVSNYLQSVLTNLTPVQKKKKRENLNNYYAWRPLVALAHFELMRRTL